MTEFFRRVTPGQPVFARQWNTVTERVTENSKRLGLAGQRPGTAVGSAVPFRYQTSDGDVVLARQFIGGVESTTETPIAKPYTLRPSVTVRGGHVYAYASDFERTDTFNANVETQVLTPQWEVDDIVFAEIVPYDTGVSYDSGGGLEPVIWLLRSDGWQWAQKFGT